MLHNKALILTGLFAALGLAGCECLRPAKGTYAGGSPDNAVHRILLAADASVIRIETLVGGNWEEATLTPGDAGEGTKLLDIKVYTHDGSLTGLKKDDGTTFGKETHPHTGGQNPPWNSHCHYVYYVGGVKYTTHC